MALNSRLCDVSACTLLNFELLSLVIEAAKTKIVKVDYHLVKSGKL